MELAVLLFSMCHVNVLVLNYFFFFSLPPFPSIHLRFFFFLTSEATQQKATDAKPPSNPCVYLSTLVSRNTVAIIWRIWANFHLFVGLGYSLSPQNSGVWV